MKSEVAKYLRISFAQYCKLERGKIKFSVSDIQKLSYLFGVTTQQILDHEKMEYLTLPIYELPFFCKVEQLDEIAKANRQRMKGEER